MSTAASENRPLAAPTTSAVWPVLFLVAIAGVCWAVTVERMQGMDMGPGTDLGGLGWFAVVWVTMMAAMMLPSLSPMAVAYWRAAGGGQARSIARTVVFAAGYLLPWAAFGVLAYALVEGVRSLDLGFLAWDRAGQYVAGAVILGALRADHGQGEMPAALSRLPPAPPTAGRQRRPDHGNGAGDDSASAAAGP